MSHAQPGYATKAQMRTVSVIRRRWKDGESLLVLTHDYALDIGTVSRIVRAHSREGAAKVLAELSTKCQDSNASQRDKSFT